MAVTDKKLEKGSAVAKKWLRVPIITAVSQADVRADSHVPGHDFEIESVVAYCTGATAVISVDVKIGTTSAPQAAITPASASSGRVAGTLKTNVATLRGDSDDAINVHYTTDGAGAGVNLRVEVKYRPRPLNGEV